MNPYINDILSQPDALRRTVRSFSTAPLSPLADKIRKREIDRILITGMGASYNTAYPAYISLTDLPIPVLHLNAAELVHYLGGLIGNRTLLWINSQSGRSAELLHLFERIQSTPPACILTCVNDETSPLAVSADICLPIHAGKEITVSTKSYTNTLATNLLTTHYLTGKDVDKLKVDMLRAADSMDAYLADWHNHVSGLSDLLGEFKTLFLIGRGASMGAVWNGALISKEAAKYPLEGMNAADFRHGPLELVSPDFVSLILAGADKTIELNRNLALDILEHDGRVIWVDKKQDGDLSTILIPNTDDLLLPLMEILPMQLLPLVLAERNNVTVGQFNIIGKVTHVE